MHRYTVELRIISDHKLDFNLLTSNLGIVPTNTRQHGEVKSASMLFTESMWGYSIDPESNSDGWDSLEEALESLFCIFLPLKDKIAEYNSTYKVVIWCGHFTSSFDGGPTLSPSILKKLGDFGVELFIDTYRSEESE